MSVEGVRVDLIPLVDVGIPVYDRADFLAAAIESVLGQTMLRFRLVVSVDGPAVESVRRVAVRYLDDPRVAFVSSEEHVGAAAHMTRIVAGGEAPFFALLHDDDVWDETFLARRVGLLEAHPECGFAFSPVRVIDADGVEIEQTRVRVAAGVYAPEAFVPLLVQRNIVPSPSVVVRRATYASAGGTFDHSFARIYDHELWFRLATFASVGVLAGADASWRSHGRQSTRSVSDRRGEFKLFLDGATRQASGVSGFVLTEQDRRRILAGWSLSNALDAAEQRAVKETLASAGTAVHAAPLIIFDPRFAALIVALAMGRRGAQALRRLRTSIRRRNINVHLTKRSAP